MKIQAIVACLFRELAPLIDIQPIGTVESTHIQIKPAIIINIGKRRARAPHPRRIDTHFRGHIFKMKAAKVSI